MEDRMRTCRNFRHLVPGTTLLAVCFLVSSFAAGSARAAAPVERHDWAVGLAWGLGNGSVTLVDQAEGTDWARGGSPQLRVGRRVGSHLMVGLENRQWLNEAGYQDYKIRGNVQNLCLVLTAYPGRATDLTSGLYVQAGYGWAHGRLSGLEPIDGGPHEVDDTGANEWGETYEVIYKHDAGGWGAVLGLGYEFRINRHCAAGLAVSYNFLSFDDDVFEEAEFVPASLNLNWYF
jgi:hypothetical protein